jgi:ribosomal protein L16 Arg81 hydroxylase
MSMKFDEVRVYTTDSVMIPAKNKQAIIDEWTDALANKMASETTYNALEDEFGIKVSHQERRGGHNRKTVEVLNTDGYLTAVYNSVKEASESLHVNSSTLLYHIDGRTRGLVHGQAVRFRNNK